MLYSEKIIDDLGKFIISDAWKVIKYRLLVEFTSALQDECNIHTRNEAYEKTSAVLGKIDGINEAIKITERLNDEIKRGKLDVDEALNVIEKKEGGRK